MIFWLKTKKKLSVGYNARESAAEKKWKLRISFAWKFVDENMYNRRVRVYRLCYANSDVMLALQDFWWICGNTGNLK